MCALMMTASSHSEKGSLMTPGSSWLHQRSRQLLPLRPLMPPAIRLQFLGPCICSHAAEIAFDFILIDLEKWHLLWLDILNLHIQREEGPGSACLQISRGQFKSLRTWADVIYNADLQGVNPLKRFQHRALDCQEDCISSSPNWH